MTSFELALLDMTNTPYRIHSHQKQLGIYKSLHAYHFPYIPQKQRHYNPDKNFHKEYLQRLFNDLDDFNDLR